MNLRIPGPTPLPPEVLKAASRQMINHRGKEYQAIQARVAKNLRHFFRTKHDVFLYTASGTGGLEAAIANFFSPGDTILSLTCGIFGERWADAARAFGLRVIQVKFPHGQAVDAHQVQEVFQREKDICGVFVTHNETSTGVLNPVREIIKKGLSFPGKDRPFLRPLVLVDAVSSLGAVELPMDDWGIDVVVTASQKAWMAPPGLSMMAVSPRAWQRHKTATLPRYYFDITLMKQYAKKNQTPATPAVSAIFGLDAALRLMMNEGRKQIFSRHLKLRDMFRTEVKKLGLNLLVDDAHASPTVTSIRVPDGIHAHDWQEKLVKHDIIVSGGLRELAGKIIRVAHMGYVSERDMLNVIQALAVNMEKSKSVRI